VLFVPGEAFLAPALERDPSLLEHAYARRVHIATPTTLVSLLRAVAHAWQQQALADGAREVLVAGRALYDRLATLGGHVDKLGRSLDRAVCDFNATVGSLERSVVPAVRRMVELQAVDAPLPPPGARSRRCHDGRRAPSWPTRRPWPRARPGRRDRVRPQACGSTW
jgi:DNA recombination protein RmuC